MVVASGKIDSKDVMPEVGPFVWYLDAFRELSTCRAIGMAEGPIPFTAIVEYSRIYDVEDFEEFLYLMRVMDREYLRINGDKIKGKSNSGGTKSNANNKNTGSHRR